MLKQIGWVVVMLVSGAGVANAQPAESTTVIVEQPGPYSYAWRDPTLRTGIGVGLQFGGGIAGFTNSTMRDVLSSSVEGMWQGRLILGSHTPIGIEAAYIGTSADIRPLGAGRSGTLLGTDVEGALRWNALPHSPVNPYIFAGVGWQRFDIRDVNFNVSDTGVRDKDDLVVYPLGAGVSYRDRGFVFDIRGTFRPATNADLVLESRSTTAAPMHQWDVGAQLGYEL